MGETIRFEPVTRDERWGVVGDDGALLLVEDHRYHHDPYSLWHLPSGDVAVLFEDLQHTREHDLRLGDFDGAVIALVGEAAREVKVIADHGLEPPALAAAAGLASASAGLAPHSTPHRFRLGDATFTVTVAIDFETLAWRCTVEPAT